jgi:recombinational DNA repair ATPase RecF
LLDEVLSELVAARQDYLVGTLCDCQSVITCCAPELIADRTDADVFTMIDGRLLV